MPKKHEFDMEDVGGRKTLIVLCVDTSNSLYTWQREVNNAIKSFFNELEKEPKARYGTEVAVVTYDTKPHLHTDFTKEKSAIKPIQIPDKNPTGGWTDIGEALSYSIDLAISAWKKKKASGVPVYLPWIILFTDGKPENKERNAEQKLWEAARALQSYEYPQKSNDKILFIGIGVGDNVDVQLMQKISAHGRVRYLHANNFSMLSQLFKFVGATTVSGVGQQNDFDDQKNSFVFQKPKSDPVDMSDGGFGVMEQSPAFSEPPSPAGNAFGDFNLGFADELSQNGQQNVFSPNNPQTQPIGFFSAPTPSYMPPTPPKASADDLDNLLEEMIRISSSNSSFD